MPDDCMANQHCKVHARAQIIADAAHCRRCRRFGAGGRRTPKLTGFHGGISPCGSGYRKLTRYRAVHFGQAEHAPFAEKREGCYSRMISALEAGATMRTSFW